MRRQVLTLLAVLFAAGALPHIARADGDPASDVLLAENVFYPYSPTVSPNLQKTLNAETAAAGHSHFPIKVALIASPEDLGAIPQLYGHPQEYANFLDQEISYSNRRLPLLVVMADGYGVRGIGKAATLAAATLPKPSDDRSDALARAAIGAIRKLAAAAGHPIADLPSLPAAKAGGGTSSAAILLLASITAAGAITLWRRRRPQPRGRARRGSGCASRRSR